jgi:hypothetical protein
VGAVSLFWLQFNSRFGCFLLCSTLLPCSVRVLWCCCQELELCWFFGFVLLGLHLGVGVVRLGYLVWCFPPEALRIVPGFSFIFVFVAGHV